MQDNQADSPRAFTNPFTIDVRALALLRIALGAIVFVDLALRMTELGVLYNDGAAYPLERARETLFAPIALHLLSGSPWWQGGLMALGILCAALLVIGYRTRLMTLLTWYLVISLHHRVYHIQDVGDQLLRLLLLWCVFLPLGERYSMDARSSRRGACSGASSVTSIASAGLLCQVALLYFFGALHKLKGATWHTGDALEMVLQDDVWVRPLGGLIEQVPWMTRSLTFATVWAELLLPLLLLSPLAIRACRTVAIPLLALFAVGIGSCLHLGVIPWVISAALMPFLPPEIWDRLDRRLGAVGSATGAGVGVPSTGGGGALRMLFGKIVPGILLVQLFSANIDSLNFPGRVPIWIRKTEFCLGLDQAWGMYAPDPVVSSFRLQLRLDLANGERVEVMFGGERDGWPQRGEAFEPFDDLWNTYRGRMLLDNIVYPELAMDLRPFLVWACGEWASAHPDRPVRSAGLSKEVRVVRHGTSAALHPVLRTEPLLGHVCTDHR